jgi:beta-glucosidase
VLINVTYFQLTHYRFSISWSRVLPDGTIDNINEKGIEYYDNLINALLDAGVQPMVTLFHNDLPQALEEKYGGFLSRDVISHFVDYAKLMFERFGDRVGYESHLAWMAFVSKRSFST